MPPPSPEDQERTGYAPIMGGPRGAARVPQRASISTISKGSIFDQGGGIRLGTGVPLASRPQGGAVPQRAVARPAFELGQPVPPQGPNKTTLGIEEARDLLQGLDQAVSAIEMAQREAKDYACARDIGAGAFPLVVKLRDRLREFIISDAPGSGFQVSQGELELVDKTLACQEAISSGETRKKVATVAAVGAGAMVLFLVL